MTTSQTPHPQGSSNPMKGDGDSELRAQLKTVIMAHCPGTIPGKEFLDDCMMFITAQPQPTHSADGELTDILFDLAADAILNSTLHTGDTGVDRAKERIVALIQAQTSKAVLEAEKQITLTFLKAFEAKAYFLVSDFSGSEPHPQLEMEMLEDFVELIKTTIEDPEVPLHNDEETVDTAVANVLAALHERQEGRDHER